MVRIGLSDVRDEAAATASIATEKCFRVVHAALQVHGAGYMTECETERLCPIVRQLTSSPTTGRGGP